MKKTVYILVLLFGAAGVTSCSSTGPAGERTDRVIEQPRAICADCEPTYHPLPVER